MPPRPPRPTLFPYTTLFRSGLEPGDIAGVRRAGDGEGQRVPDFAEADKGAHLVDVAADFARHPQDRSEEHTSELQSRPHLVCRLLLEKKNKTTSRITHTATI